MITEICGLYDGHKFSVTKKLFMIIKRPAHSGIPRASRFPPFPKLSGMELVTQPSRLVNRISPVVREIRRRLRVGKPRGEGEARIRVVKFGWAAKQELVRGASSR
jgi:hypothetical protein